MSVRDERSAGFAALGYAKATGRPAVVLCTSGSAATHFLPAIVEANQSATPLIALTADRPIRLRGTSAPQTMDQVNLYGSHVKSFVDLNVTDTSRAHEDAITLVGTAVARPPGPTHANIPLDTPLVPTSPTPRSLAPGGTISGAYQRQTRDETPLMSIAGWLGGRRVMIVVGGSTDRALPAAVADFADRIGAPVFADPQSNVTGPNVLIHGDLVVSPRGSDGTSMALDAHSPDVVLRLGAIPTSKPMWTWLETSGVEQVLIVDSRLTDPLDSATHTIAEDPADVLRDVVVPRNPDRVYLDTWTTLDRSVGRAVHDTMASLPFPNEPAIAHAVVSSAPPNSIVFVGSSRPIRDLDAFAIPRKDVTVIANRGVNGIDGAISTALGVALTGTPTTLYIGDVTALHDVSALSEVARLGAPIRIVVVNNDGGGIFSFLPHATSDTVHPTIYERHWGTPHGLSITPIAQSMGLSAIAVTTSRTLTDALSSDIESPGLVEITTDRSTNIEHHRALRRVATAATVARLQDR